MNLEEKNNFRFVSFLSLLLLSFMAFGSGKLLAEPANSPEDMFTDTNLEKATLSRETSLRETPSSDAEVVVTLPAKTTVVVKNRSGAWAEVETENSETGFVRILNLRTVSSKKGKSGLGAVLSTFRTGSSGQSVSTGVKGMSAEQLENASPDNEQVKRLSKYTVKEKKVRKSAKAAGLKLQDVPELEKPEGE